MAESVSARESWKENMSTVAITEKILKCILADLKAALKSEKTSDLLDKDFLQRHGMVDGINLLEGQIDTWVTHQKNLRKLRAGSLPRLVTKNVKLSAGRYRKFEWYQGKRFIALAFRWGRNQAEPEIGLQIQDCNTLRSEFLVYQGTLGYDDLLDLAKRRGLRGVRSFMTPNEWRAT